MPLISRSVKKGVTDSTFSGCRFESASSGEIHRGRISQLGIGSLDGRDSEFGHLGRGASIGPPF